MIKNFELQYSVFTGIDDLKAVRTELLPLTAKWEDLGGVLELKPGKTDEIGLNNNNKAGPCLKDVLSEWLHGNGIRPTNWQTMLTCLKDPIMGKGNFADDLKKKLTTAAQNDIN